ncbi:3-deoxy-D-manno-octulosonic acid transferase [Arundinibacter roseus]|uniref:3-deoxy-D-manno-octulosonic acid transferase n=1 Tax=Arundinibacter roseus TaxID=2070510 RepID=UPI001E61830F|nr:glycosyltransferase N-terminal domain-containing protein [Arundinibacter roseus]
MAILLYRLSIEGYALLMRFAALFHPKARLWVQGRRGLLAQLQAELPGRIKHRPVAWFHAASLGEFEQGRPVIEAFRLQYPEYFIFLTFFSPSGYEVRKNYAGADYVTYLPIDSPTHARQLVQLLQPQIAFFIKYEFWHFYLRELRQNHAVILSFSAIFRPGQLFFKPYGQFYRNILLYFNHLFVQNKESEELLKDAGIQDVTIAGDTRFDRVGQLAEAARKLPEIAAFVGSLPCLIVGSAWEADRAVLVSALSGLSFPIKTIVAPHEIHEADLQRWEQTLPGKTLRYSVYTSPQFDVASLSSYSNLLIDNIGMLSSLYRYGHVAYIGGAFGAGLHNILEAATYGLPVLFGNRNYLKFQEAVDLCSQGGALALPDSEACRAALTELLTDLELRTKRGKINQAYVQAHRGATAAVMKQVEKLLKS